MVRIFRTSRGVPAAAVIGHRVFFNVIETVTSQQGLCHRPISNFANYVCLF
jgi:hypothetical protein